MQRKSVMIACLSAVIMCGCAGVKVVKKDFAPQYMCSGDTLTASVELNKKVDVLKVVDGRGVQLEKWKNRKKFELTVPNITESMLQFEVIAKKGGGTKTVKSDFELFDNPDWSKPIDTVGYQTALRDERTFISDQYCYCNYDTTGNCVQKICIDQCTVHHELYVTLTGFQWAFPAYNYSPRVKVSGIRNLNPFSIDVTVQGNSRALPPSQEHTFDPVGIDDMVVGGQLIPPQEKNCGSVEKTFTKHCSYILPEDLELGKGYYPDVSDCFSDQKAQVALRLQCNVP